MKTIYVICIIILTIIITPLNAQNTKSGTPFDLSLGYGALHGGLGGKATLNNVIYLGLGVLKNQTLWELGIQYPFRLDEMKQTNQLLSSFFITCGYGGIGVKEEYRWNSNLHSESDTKVVNGWTILAGYLYSFGPGSRLFIDIDAGYSFGSTKFFEGTDLEFDYKLNVFTVDGGIGYRF